MSRSDEIFGEISEKPFSLKNFIRDHKVGILGTIAFHLILLIAFLLIEIHSYQKIHELDIVFDFAEETEDTKPLDEEPDETREEYLTRLVEQQLRQSNQAVNISKLEEELSTENYVEEVMNELEDERSEEWLKQQDELQKILSQDDIVPVKPEPDQNEHEKEFSGPTNISYEFLSPPYDRKSLRLIVPVYKCQGYGIVEVKITVNNSGEVTSAKANVIEATEDPACLAEVAERFALQSTFKADFGAPSSHEGKIVYSFVAQ